MPTIAPEQRRQAEPTIERYEFFIEGMHCASCVTRIETALKKLPGVAEVRVNPGTSTAVVQYVPQDVRPIAFRRAIEQAGPYRAVQLEPRRGTSVAATDYWARHEEPFKARMAISVCLSAIVAAITWHLLPASAFGLVSYGAQWVLFACASIIQWWGGWPFHSNAVASLRRGVTDMNTLISLGSFAAYGASVVSTVVPQWLLSAGVEPQFYYETSAFIITFILVGRWFEAKAKRTAGDALKSLLRLQPMHARVLRGGRERRVPVEDVRVGEPFVLRPGDRVPVDGVIEEGHSFLNEAVMTGESTPREARAGDRVMSGTHNLRGRLVCRATRVGRDTTLAQVFQLVEDAQSAKVPAQRMADRVAGIFVPIVIGLAAVTFLAWWLFWPQAGKVVWAISSAVAVLVVACPCALGLATPLAVMIGVGRAAQGGILLRHPAALELTGNITDIVLDKTGTVTVGRPEVARVVLAPGVTEEELLRVTAAAERSSEHPLGEAIVRYAESRHVNIPPVTSFEVLPGAGLKAIVQEYSVLIGAPMLLESSRIIWGPLQPALDEARRDATASIIAVAVGQHAQGLILVADQLKPDAVAAVAALRRRLTVHLVTGDQPALSQAVAQQLGVTLVRAQCLPQDKVAYVQRLREQGKIVAMVGDGINDAPALTHAHLAIAMGRSADVAAEIGDIILLRNELMGVVRALDLSRRVTRTIAQNLCWAFVYNVLMIPMAAGVFYPFWGVTIPPVLAGAFMAGSSLSVVFNSLRLRNA